MLDLNVSQTTNTRQTAEQGEMARFECGIGGLPKPQIVWSRDGRNLLPQDDVR